MTFIYDEVWRLRRAEATDRAKRNNFTPCRHNEANHRFYLNRLDVVLIIILILYLFITRINLEI